MYKVYGKKEKGKQPSENAEMITFFNVLREDYPDLAVIATHIKNEGKRNINQIGKDKAEGLVTGFPDIVILGNPAFCCEMKSKGKSKISEDQEKVLNAATKNGAFACVAYGYEAAIDAVIEWLNAQA